MRRTKAREHNMDLNLLGGAAGSETEIPEKFYQPEQVDLIKDGNPVINSEGKTKKVPYDFDSLKIPEKLTVKNEDGSINFEKTAKRVLASTKKAVGSYTELETKLGKLANVELPPEKEDGYKLDYTAMPENLKPTPESEKSLLKHFYGLGLTNKQAQGIMSKYASILNAGMELQGKVVPEVAAEFKALHGDNLPAVMQHVTTAFNALADDEDKANLGKLGKDLKATYKTLTKILAKVGADLQEDVPPGGGPTGGDADIDVLMKSEAYWNMKHAEHAVTVAKVKAYFDKKNKT